jgi:predicted RND superfamily exporter protein
MGRAFFAGMYRARWAVVAATLTVTALLAPQVATIRFDSSSEGSVPRNDVNQAYFERVKEDFGNDQVAMVVLLSRDELGVFNAGTLTKIAALTETLADLDGVDNVVSLTNSTFLSGLGGDELVNDLIVPEIPPDREAARILRRDVLANPIFHQSLVSTDGRAAAINVFLANQPDSLLLATGLDDKIAALVADAQGPEEVYYAGLIHTRMEINKTMKRDLGRFVPMSFAMILLILLVAFRSVRGVLIPALTILIALIWTFGLIGLLGVTISLTTTIIPPLLIALACSMSIHVVAAFQARAAATGDKQEAVVGAFSEVAAPLIIAALTTAIGFGSLVISPIPNTQKVGVFAVAGILLAILVVFTFAPAMLSILPLPRARTAGRPGRDIMPRLVESIIRINMRRRGLILALAGVVMVLSVVGLLRIEVDTDFLSYFKEDSDVRQAADIIGENLAGVSTFYVIASSDSTDTAAGSTSRA